MSPTSSLPLPLWARQLADLYESEAGSQFILFGNVNDRFMRPGAANSLGTLSDFLCQALLSPFDVILSYDVGQGIRLLKGGERFGEWPRIKENPELPKDPRAAMEVLTQFARYAANLGVLGRKSARVAILLQNVDLIAPATQGWYSYDVSAVASLIRNWSQEELLTGHGLATFLIVENINDLHPLLANNLRAAQVRIPLPTPDDLRQLLQNLSGSCAAALRSLKTNLPEAAASLSGSTFSAVEGMLKTKQHLSQALTANDLGAVKKQMVEKDCGGLIEFIESERTLADFKGNDPVKAWLTQDVALWKKNDPAALPKGYLICGPVGTGKTFLVDCLAGEADVPIVKMKNFRDKWVGSTEGNLEKIFRLIRALGRCYVFIDEADQALGRRESSSNDAGLSGRIYSMMAEEMGNADSRGRVIWILASSRPDQIEVDLKRPGRIDVKIPLFPTSSPEEGFQLIQFLCRRRKMDVPDNSYAALSGRIPEWLTPGAAEALAMKIYRSIQTQSMDPVRAIQAALQEYRSPIPRDVLEAQIDLAVREASDLEFIPKPFRKGTKPPTF